MKSGVELLLDYLDNAFGALNLACSAHEAFFRLHWNRFLILDLIDAHGTRVNACAAASAFVVVNHYFYHSSFLFKSEFHCKSRQ
jgi:hypothetical protein